MPTLSCPNCGWSNDFSEHPVDSGEYESLADVKDDFCADDCRATLNLD